MARRPSLTGKQTKRASAQDAVLEDLRKNLPRGAAARNPFADIDVPLTAMKTYAAKPSVGRETRVPQTIRFAFVTDPLDDSQFTPIETDLRPATRMPRVLRPLERDLYPYVKRLFIRPGSTARIRRLEDEFVAVVNYAVSQKCQVICFGEMAFPTLRGEPRVSFQKKLFTLADTQNLLLVAGTAHDVRTCYNTMFVYFPGCPRYGLPYHKQISACRQEERVRVPTPRVTPLIKWNHLHFGLLTCLDLQDFTSVSHVVRHHSGIQVLLVPSYSRGDVMLKRCARETSADLPGIVALVNCHKGDDLGLRVWYLGSEVSRGQMEQRDIGERRVWLWELEFERFCIDAQEMREQQQGQRGLFGKQTFAQVD